MSHACRRCLLPAAAPWAGVDGGGLCRHCRRPDAPQAADDESLRLGRVADLEAALDGCRNHKPYACLVALSGGKDSCYLLYRLVREYGLNVLAFTVDVNLTPIAWRNIHRTVAALDVPHVTFRPPREFYRKLFRFLLQNQESRGAVRTVCYVCAALCEGYALRAAVEKDIPLVLAGYSPGQPEPDRMVYEFSREMICGRDWTPPEVRASGLFSEEELTLFWNPARHGAGKELPRFLAPFHAWEYDQAQVMEAVVRLGLVANRRHASPVLSNCPLNWLLMYSDLKNLGYNPYAPEFSRLVRQGKASRLYWRVLAPLVDAMIRRRVGLGRNVTRSLRWLGLRTEELQITRAAPLDDSRLVRTIPELLAARAAARPDAPVVSRRAGPGRWLDVSWREFHQQVVRAADELRRGGLLPGQRVAVIAPTSQGWQLAEMACLQAGGVVVGIDPQASDEQLAHILRHCRPHVVIVENGAILDCIPADVLGQRPLVMEIDAEKSALRRSDRSEESAPAAEILRCAQDDARAVAQDDALAGDLGTTPSPGADDPATWIYTSGTTGQPKAIVYSHRQLLIACRAISEQFPELAEGDTTLCWLPMAHLFQRMLNLVAMARGVTIHFVDDPRQLVACAGEVRPAVLAGVPRFYEKLYQGMMERLPVLRGWRRILRRSALRRLRGVLGGRLKFMVTGSAPIDRHVLEFFHHIGLPLLEAYGISENAVPMTINRLSEFRLGSVGRPLAPNEIRLADDGEVLVRGPGVFGGYVRACSEGPAALFTPDGFFHTGDLGLMDEDGFLYLTGRKSDIIKTSTGRRIAPRRIESAYAGSVFFERVVVVGNGRPWPAGLVVLNAPRVKAWLADRHAAAPAADENLSSLPAVRELVRRELDARGRELADHERIERFAILPEPLSVDRGELTPTLKLRRECIERRYAERIEQLYVRVDS